MSAARFNLTQQTRFNFAQRHRFWFTLGRHRRNHVLGWLCRISLEPDSCVRRTQNVFARYGVRGVVFAKFFPGVSTIVPPMAGMSHMNASRFFLFDAAGALLYGGLFLLVGYAFSNQIDQIAIAISHIGASAFSLLAGFAALYVERSPCIRRPIQIIHQLIMSLVSKMRGRAFASGCSSQTDQWNPSSNLTARRRKRFGRTWIPRTFSRRSVS